jgi:hypothetical protein
MSKQAVQLPSDVTANRLAVELGVEYPVIPDGYVSFKGYLSEEHNGLRRLFCNDTFEDWIEVKASDIAARIDVPPNDMDARCVLYVKRKARVILCHALDADEVPDAGIDPGGESIPAGHPPWHHG